MRAGLMSLIKFDELATLIILSTSFRKFSAQNYLKIRETKKYTQKTLNRVLDNMPALYLDLSSCKQGIGDTDLRDWQDEMDRR